MKNKIVAGLLALFLGTLGFHRFYLDETRAGVIYLVCTIIGWLTSWLGIGLVFIIVISILSLIDAIKYLTMSDKYFDLRYNTTTD